MEFHTVVGGRYRLGSQLGQGGMAVVRVGLDARLGRIVAVKQLTSALAADPGARELFSREAHAAAGLNHPRIVRVFDAGEDTDPLTGLSTPYIVMEFVRGQTLSSLLRRRHKLPPRRALKLTRAVLEALAYSHRMGIIHQDIKPSNVMITQAVEVKLMDFGISRGLAEASGDLAFGGTAKYLSPEQATGQTTDTRSDIYSTGCLLYALLVGRPPFRGETFGEVAQHHLRSEPIPPSQVDGDVDPAVDAVVLKSLAKDAGARYQSADAMIADIDALLAQSRPILRPAPMRKEVAGSPVGPQVAPRPLALASPGSSAKIVAPPTAVRRRTALIAAGLVALVGPVSYSLYQSGGLAVDQAQGQPVAQVLRVSGTRGPQATAPVPRQQAPEDSADQRPSEAPVDATSAVPRGDLRGRGQTVPQAGPEVAASDRAPSPVVASRPRPDTGTSARLDPGPSSGSDPTAEAPAELSTSAKPVRRGTASAPANVGQPASGGPDTTSKPDRPGKPDKPKPTPSAQGQRPKPPAASPGKPSKSVDPVKPAEPEQPQQPDRPAQPDEPAEPTRPDQPTKPAEPDKPKPDKPKQDKPDKPGKPKQDRPDKPDKPKQDRPNKPKQDKDKSDKPDKDKPDKDKPEDKRTKVKHDRSDDSDERADQDEVVEP